MTDKVELETERVEQKNESPIKSLAIILIAAVLLGMFISKDPQRFWNIMLVLVGFSAVIFVHELGHFVAAKSVGIMVEAFSIGFGPTVIGCKRVQEGLLLQLLFLIFPRPLTS